MSDKIQTSWEVDSGLSAVLENARKLKFLKYSRVEIRIENLKF